eukprot:GEZU01020554.1.p2 GENE.GEZU01020554.1~~GEZU01020554.1.p2  ORF type:complete len:120 (+),score=34.46 GEZU01020554.1:141-500(+)
MTKADSITENNDNNKDSTASTATTRRYGTGIGTQQTLEPPMPKFKPAPPRNVWQRLYYQYNVLTSATMLSPLEKIILNIIIIGSTLLVAYGLYKYTQSITFVILYYVFLIWGLKKAIVS